MAFDKEHPFKNLGIRILRENGKSSSTAPLEVEDVEVSLSEFSGINGMQQILKTPQV